MKKVIIFGGSGLVGSRFIELKKKSFEILAPDAAEVDILEKDQIKSYFTENPAESVINFAAYTNVEEAEKQKDDRGGLCFKINAVGAKNVAEACRDLDKYLIHISTEYVFDGTKENSPYTEEDTPNPINWYGKTKHFGEQFITQTGGKSVIVRISMPYSPFYDFKKDVARFFLEELKNSREVKAIEDQRVTPTLVDDIADALGLLLEKSSTGIYHVSATDSVSPLEFAKTIAETFKLDYQLIGSVKFEEYSRSKNAQLLKYSWLNPTKFEKEFGEGILHSVEEDLQLFKLKVKTD